MSIEDYISTGEASRLLNISRSTVSRKFDRGLLQGRRNPITGERLISRKSLVALMEQYQLHSPAVEKKRILLGTGDEQLASRVQKIFAEDERVRLRKVGFGGDILLEVPREHPDLVIIDEGLPDIAPTEVLKALRRAGEREGGKILYLARSAKAKPPLNIGADEVLSGEDLERETLAGKLYALLRLSEKVLPVQSFEHRRRWPRFMIHLPARISVYRRSSPQRREPGQAQVENISCGGAYLSQIQLQGNGFPAEPFRILLELDQAPLKNWRAHCKVVRFQSNGSLSAGVQFVRLSKPNLRLIQQLAEK